jgi:hypothetical protein
VADASCTAATEAPARAPASLELLAALEIEDALSDALAAYAIGRRAQIQRLRWCEVDLRVGAIEWGGR